MLPVADYPVLAGYVLRLQYPICNMGCGFERWEDTKHF